MVGMKFTPLASSSKGNCYLVEAAGVAAPPFLLLEAGIPIKAIREKLGFRLSELAGCIISHEHGDHSKAVKDLLRAGVDCYCSAGTAQALGIEDHHRHIEIRVSNLININGWWVMPFSLQHDAEEPVGFIISHGNERLLFIPDTSYVENRFAGITRIAVECNHISDLLSKNIQGGRIPQVIGKRVRRNHMSLETLVLMLRSNDLSECRAIYLLHLSDGNSDEARMIREVQEATGVPTYTAAKAAEGLKTYPRHTLHNELVWRLNESLPQD